MSPKQGQKLTNNPKNKLIQIRMDKEDVVKLDYLASKQNLDRSKIIRKGIEIQYKHMTFTLKRITKEIKEIIDDVDVPIKYNKNSPDNISGQNSILFFKCVSEEERAIYENLTEEEKKEFVSNSAYISILLINVEELYELYHTGISCDYEVTISMIKEHVPVNKDNEKILFAVFVILHEFGHWIDFKSKDKKPYLCTQDEKDKKEVYDLKVKILNDESLREKSDYKIRKELKDWVNRYNLVPSEKRANDYAISKIKDVYNVFKERGYIV